MKYVVVGFFLIATVVSGMFFYTWYRFHQKLNIHVIAEVRPMPQGWPSQARFVTNEKNQKIAYWYFPVSNPKAVVILIHEYSNPGGKAQMLGHAEYLYRAGYSTVLLDLRSFGESEGDKITLGIDEWKDVDVVYDEVMSLPEN
jgi:alpha-beta hydrolase superfamily lysophospholipase